MLTRKAPETLAVEVTLKGQASSLKFNVVFFNRTQEEINEFHDEVSKHEAAKTDMQYANRQTFMHVVKEWESEFDLTDEELKAAEKTWPGLIEMTFIAYHRARRVELTKN